MEMLVRSCKKVEFLRDFAKSYKIILSYRDIRSSHKNLVRGVIILQDSVVMCLTRCMYHNNNNVHCGIIIFTLL